MADGYEYRSEHAGSLKRGKVFDKLSSYQLYMPEQKRRRLLNASDKTSNFGGQILNQNLPNKCQKCYFLRNGAVCILLFYQVVCCKSVARLEKGRSIKREGVSSMEMPGY
jgi:hypothetical protein